MIASQQPRHPSDLARQSRAGADRASTHAGPCEEKPNFVTDDGLGSLEYGAKVLGTKLILVLGHHACGAVKAAVAVLRDHTALPGHIQGLVEAMKPGIAPVLEHAHGDATERAVLANVRYNVQRLSQAQPLLAEMVRAGELAVVGGVYDLASGRVEFI